MLTTQLEQAYSTLSDKKKEAEGAPATVAEASDEEKEVSAQQANALAVLSAQIPSIMELALAIAADKLLPDVPGSASDKGASNGASGNGKPTAHVA